VFILHGGLFGQPGVLLEEVMEASRKDYNLAEEARKAKAAAPRVEDMVSTTLSR
jgi:hypothetical protein